ncbi:PREDICTED: uncharacterized protein LOC108561064 [Nicrophorus vespilloides]|uniref:Uncharacterized protein LOC108561064 n=1 Tax=Nicrophorus vespilloides TaxID=110193 RepID=A0ABM1MIC6_NICVS|nr:PREDICTED: uncharacterized protein LOC108561064 [Nicrophorus vespilloides]
MYSQQQSYPKIWSTFTGKKDRKSYEIRDAREEHYEAMTQGMINHFLREEPTCKYQGCYDDNEFIDELKDIWLACYKRKMSLVCLDESSNVAGFLLLTKEEINDEPIIARNEKWKKICDIIGYISTQKNPFETFKITEYLSDLGMLVLPDYRGQGIAEHLLNTCDLVAKQHKLSLLAMTFSSYMSQSLAHKLSFLELYRISFEELRKIDAVKYGIDNIEEHTKDIQYLYRLYR